MPYDIPGLRPETLFSCLTTTCGEGPVWLPKTGELVFIDFLTSSFYRYYRDTGNLAKKIVSGRPGITVTIPTENPDEFLIPSGQQILRYNWSTEEYKVLTDFDLDTGSRANDAKADSQGRLWFGSRAEATTEGHVPPGMGSLYRLDGRGLKKAPALPVDLSNGLEWTRDDRVMFFTDSIKRVIYAFDFDAASGEIANQRVCVDFKKLPADAEPVFRDKSVPDGCCLDNRGRLWSACYYGSCVACFDVETGQLVERIPLPTACVTSCCFGGPDFNELYVTSACEDGVVSNQLGGSVFHVKGLHVHGFPSFKASF